MGDQEMKAKRIASEKVAKLPEGSLVEVLEQLKKTEDLLRERVSDLAHRLSPISLPEEPRPQDTATRASAMSSFAADLYEIHDRLNESIFRIEGLMNLVDL